MSFCFFSWTWPPRTMPHLAHQDPADPSRGDGAFHGAGFGTDVRTRTTWSRGKAWHQTWPFIDDLFFFGEARNLESFSNFQGVTLCFFSWGLWVLPTARFIHNAFSIRPLHPHEATISLHWVMPSDDQSESRANCFPYKMVETNEHKRL